MAKRHAAFLDRDGTIIADPGYLKSADDVRLLPGAAQGMTALRGLGYALVVISNRAGVARGLITATEAAAVHEAFVELLRAEGVELAGAYYCDHSAMGWLRVPEAGAGDGDARSRRARSRHRPIGDDRQQSV